MGRKILIVDDNPSVLKLLNISLSKADYEIVEAENGEVAFQVANKEMPDLIISDIMMPQMDGIELCWMIRENSEVPLVPFIFLTSFDDSEMEIRGFRAGADEYLNKPIDRKELLERVEELLSRTDKLKTIDDTSDSKKAFEGDLKDLSIVELVQMLNLNKKSGILHIDGAKQGEVFLQNGQLIGAKTEANKSEEAIYELVTFDQGSFKFEVTDDGLVANIKNSTMNVIMEACRIMDENKHANE